MDLPEPPALPTHVGRFAVLGRLGRGGMGVVYLAHDAVLDRKVAVKVLAGRLAGTVRAQVRFVQREAQAMARLSHPHVVQVYEVGEDEHGLFVAMELVDGSDLATWLREGPARSWRDRLAALLGAGRGLAAAHAAGIVHRDFKPTNVIVGNDGRARVVDFGLAGPASPDEAAVSAAERPLVATSDLDVTPTSDAARALGSPLTPGGSVLGTPGYMPPEQFLGRAVDAKSDQFAFCVTAWEVMFGARPFRGPTRAAIHHAILEQEIATPDVEVAMPSAVRAWLRQSLLRGLAVDPATRFESMDALLAAIARDPGAPRRRRIAAGIAVASVGGAVWLGYALGQPIDAACAGFGDAIATRWNDDARARIDRAFAASGSPLAAAGARAATDALDDHARALVGTRESACRATHVRREISAPALERIYACLDADERRMFAVVDVLADADASIVAHTGEAIASLEDPARCVDATEDAPRPANPDELALRDAIATASALHATAALDRARSTLATAELSATALHDDRSLADVLVLRGRVERDLGLLAPARVTLERAIDVADAARHDRARLAALLAVADVFGDGTRSLEAEARAIAQSRAVADRIGATPRERAAIAGATVDHSLRAGRLDEARVAIAALAEHADEDAPERIEREAFLARSEGDRDRARARYDEARRRALAEHGAVHPRTAAATYNAGVARIDDGDFAGAAALVHEALSAWTVIYGATPSEDIGRAHVALLGCRLGLGDLAAAREHANAAMSAYDAAVGRDHPGRAEALLGLAVVEFTEGDFAGSTAHDREAVEILAHAWGERHPQTAIARSNLGESLFAEQQLEPALRELSGAVDVLAATLGPDASDLAFPLKGLGLVKLARGEHEAAIASLQRALVLVGKADPLERLDITAALAVATWAAGDVAQARAIASGGVIDPTNAAAVQRRRSLVGWLPRQRGAFAALGLEAPEDR